MPARILFSLLSIAALLMGAAPVSAEEIVPYARILVSRPGVYRVGFEEIFGTEKRGFTAPTSALGLRVAGEPVPIWVADGGDGRLEPGDWIEFVGDAPRGEVGYFHEHSVFNAYQISLRDPVALRMRGVESVLAAEATGAATLSSVQRYEEDRELLRFASRDREAHELWYWTRLSQIEPEPFRQALELEELDRESDRPVALRIGFRGWSKPRFQRGERPADHRVEVALNGEPLDSGEWNQQEELILEIELPVETLLENGNELTIAVPKRYPEGKSDPIVDVVALNWIEATYPRRPVGGERQVRLEVAATGSGDAIAIAAPVDLLAYGEDGARVELGAGEAVPVPAASAAEGAYTLFVAAHAQLAEVDDVQPDEPSFLSSPENRADYIVIAHSKLRWALTPLIEMHEERGLVVQLVDVQDVYDEFNHGVAHPRAIRDFLSFAYHEWARPEPRFVLLAGDASWDVRNSFVVDENYAASTFLPRLGTHHRTAGGQPYQEGPIVNNRNLIPTWSYRTPQGRAAGDNWFVDVEGDDSIPEMAIGRLPVTDYWDAAHIAEKTVRYVESAEVGPWRRRALWISDGATYQDRLTDEVASEASKLGLTSQVIKPDRNDASNDGQRARLHEAFNEGQLLVHFIGHGGRFIWRTAPADFDKNRDLFTLEDLDRLEPNERLPIVLAMTCYSAPFDHPGSDSIGEKFLRLEGKGAVAVVASSWRSTPSVDMSRALLHELAQPGTIGGAFMRAKQAAGNRHFNELYNLLGDPALPINQPGIDMRLAARAGDRPGVHASFGEMPLNGHARVEWLDADGQVLAEGQQAIDGLGFEAEYQGTDDTIPSLHSVRVYVWSPEAGNDGFGVLSLSAAPAAADFAAESSETGSTDKL